MTDRQMVMLCYGFVFGIACVSNCKASPGFEFRALCEVMFAAGIAFAITVTAADVLWPRKRR